MIAHAFCKEMSLECYHGFLLLLSIIYDLKHKQNKKQAISHGCDLRHCLSTNPKSDVKKGGAPET